MRLFFLMFLMVLNVVPLETVDIRVPTRHFRDFSLFTVGSSRKTCPSARCTQPRIPFAKILTYLIILHLIIF
jgi:hypothetical protein